MFRLSFGLLSMFLVTYALHAYEFDGWQSQDVSGVISSDESGEDFDVFYDRVKRQDGDKWDLSNKIKYYCINANRTFFIDTYLGDSELAEKLDLTKPIAFIVHGYLDMFHSLYLKIDNEGWPVNTAREWVKWVDTNVCGVDWHKMSQTLYKVAADLNSKIVGRYMSEFIQMLIANGVSADNISIAGHSLGAHIAGFAGQYLNNGNVTLGRIYGLDPAGPGFTSPIVYPTEKRLNMNDARYVQTIATNAELLGSNIPLGISNFVANGGKTQPGCTLSWAITIQGATPIKFVCDHFRSVQFFRSALDPNHPFVGTRCMYHGAIGAFNNLTGLCNSPINDRFGVWTKELPGNFQLITTSSHPFCVHCLN